MIPFVAGAILVMLIACANVSGLLVGRASAREREFAVRRALGASAGQIARASLAESFAVAVPGWALGLWIALLVIRAFESMAAGAIANLQNVSLDLSVVLVTLKVNNERIRRSHLGNHVQRNTSFGIRSETLGELRRLHNELIRGHAREVT